MLHLFFHLHIILINQTIFHKQIQPALQRHNSSFSHLTVACQKIQATINSNNI